MAHPEPTIRDLTDRVHAMCRAHGWYDPASPYAQTPRNIAISVAVEAAELLEHFQWGETFQPEALAEELADVAMYLFQLADLVGVDLAQAIADKIEVNMGRTWTPSDPTPGPLAGGAGEREGGQSV